MSDKLEALLDFKEQVDQISDPDFGDFKRKFNNYLYRLAENFNEDEQALPLLRDMKSYVLYGDNLRTKAEVLFYVQYKVQNLMDQVRGQS